MQGFTEEFSKRWQGMNLDEKITWCLSELMSGVIDNGMTGAKLKMNLVLQAINADAFQRGKDAGYKAGYQHGHNEGYTKGREAGYNDGVIVGREAGQHER